MPRSGSTSPVAARGGTDGPNRATRTSPALRTAGIAHEDRTWRARASPVEVVARDDVPDAGAPQRVAEPWRGPPLHDAALEVVEHARTADAAERLQRARSPTGPAQAPASVHRAADPRCFSANAEPGRSMRVPRPAWSPSQSAAWVHHAGWTGRPRRRHHLAPERGSAPMASTLSAPPRARRPARAAAARLLVGGRHDHREAEGRRRRQHGHELVDVAERRERAGEQLEHGRPRAPPAWPV